MTKEKISTTGLVLPDGTIIEMVLNTDKNKTELIVQDGDKLVTCDQFERDNKIYVPYSEQNSLIKNKIVLLPSEPGNYSCQEEVIKHIQEYIHKYVDLDPVFEKLASYYVLLSWVYDGFNQLPYLRKCGDFGSGKTRFLTVIGSVCYKPIFASGSSSKAGLFHILNEFKGTLIFDEADFRHSDEKADLTKILNSGFTKGYPVLRCAFSKNKEFNPIGYQVYGCKVLASRKHFNDLALESRFITQKQTFGKLREDIPNELPNCFEKEALDLRNKLLRYRLCMLNDISEYKADIKLEGVEPRINQIFSPLIQLADSEFKKQLLKLAITYSKQIKTERSNTIEYHILEALQALLSQQDKVSVGDVANTVFVQYSDFHDRKITAKWIGSVISKSLNIRTYKSSGRYHICSNQEKHLNALYVRYGVI